MLLLSLLLILVRMMSIYIMTIRGSICWSSSLRLDLSVRRDSLVGGCLRRTRDGLMRSRRHLLLRHCLSWRQHNSSLCCRLSLKLRLKLSLDNILSMCVELVHHLLGTRR